MKLLISLLLPLLLLSCAEESTGPAPNGKASFWTRVENEGAITVLVDGTEVGKVTRHFPAAQPAPNCSDDGTLTVPLAPGEHLCTARSATGSTWEFSITTYSYQCDTYEIIGD